MNAVALAICGAAWLGGIALIVPSGAVAVGWRRPRPSVPAAALGTLAALGAAPLLLLAGAAGGSASDSLLPAIVGLLAALVGAFAVGRRSDVAEARGIALVEPSASMLGALALVLASAAAGFAVGLALATGGGGLVGEGVAAGEPLAAAAGSALIAAAVPGIALGAGRRRRDALAVGVAGVTLVAAAVASVPPAVAAAGSVLAALALPTGASVAPTLLSRQGLVVVGAVACAIPLLVGVLGVALLLSEPNAIGGAPGRPRGDHVALVLLAVGGLGVALLAVAERG
ncbi:MAG TPA: hypothetical protein VGK63_10675, partial [Candidatus Limnocylindrales bacterium]